MERADLTPTSFDHTELKASLIEYLKQEGTFENFDYEGSAINTIIDVLTRNTVYNSFLANMLASESFLESAQIRGNVAAHAQKLSYVPRSRIATRATCDIEITPTVQPSQGVTITEEPGIVFLSSVGGHTYTFTTKDTYTFSYSVNTGKFHATDIELYQGYFIRRRIIYTGDKLRLPSTMIDTSTLNVYVDNEIAISFNKASSISELGADSTIYFLRETSSGDFEVTFGKDVIGIEPPIGSTIILEYIDTQEDHANGAKIFIAGSTIGGYANIKIDVKQNGYGGMDSEDIESIRYMAPKVYQSQDRALAPIDYVNLTKREFPFLRSIISWGGEDNIPPRYGTQFISIVTDEDIQITDTLKRRIENSIRAKGVGSITPLVVDPNMFSLDLDVNYIVKLAYSTSSRSDIESKIIKAFYEYADLHLTKFNRYYNEMEFFNLLKGIKEIESATISKTVSHNLEVFRNRVHRYMTNYDNKIEPGSIQVSGFQALGQTVTSESIKDDGIGNMIHEYVKDGILRSVNIGVVDYETGSVYFDIALVQQDDIIKISCQIDGRNFFVRHNNVVRLSNVKTSEVSGIHSYSGMARI